MNNPPWNLWNLFDCVNKKKIQEATKLLFSQILVLTSVKHSFFLWLTLRKKLFFFYIIFWYHDFQARQEKLHCKKWKMDHISKSQYVNSNPEGFLFAIPHQKFLKAMLQKSNNISCLAVVATYKKTIHRALYNQNKTSNHVIIFNDSISKFYQYCQ